ARLQAVGAVALAGSLREIDVGFVGDIPAVAAAFISLECHALLRSCEGAVRRPARAALPSLRETIATTCPDASRTKRQSPCRRYVAFSARHDAASRSCTSASTSAPGAASVAACAGMTIA